MTGVVADHICATVDATYERRVGPPPAEHVERSRAVLDLLFRLDAQHHVCCRGKHATKSQLLKDAEEVRRWIAGTCLVNRASFTIAGWPMARARAAVLKGRAASG